MQQCWEDLRVTVPGAPASPASHPGADGGVPDSLERLLVLYHALYLTRQAEERLEEFHDQGRIPGHFHRSLGQEGGAVGATMALRRRTDGTGDLVAPTPRTTGALFVMGATPLEYLRQCLGRAGAPTGGRDPGPGWTDLDRGLLAPLPAMGNLVEVMAGVTLALKMRAEDRVGMVFTGDGATSTGAWHEGLNFAAVRRCPLILVVEANQWAFSTPTHRQTRIQSFLERCAGYGIQGVQVDGTDAVRVHEVARAAVERARAGEGVQVVELGYYRLSGHDLDDDQAYVDPAELERWRARDPLQLLRDRLLAAGAGDTSRIRELEETIRDEVVEAATEALASEFPQASPEVEG